MMLKRSLPALVGALILASLLGEAFAQTAERGAVRLTLEQANTIATKSLERARELNFAPLSVVVLDDSGHLKAMQRDGS